MTKNAFRIAIAVFSAGFSLLATTQPSAARIFVDPVRCTDGRPCACASPVRSTAPVNPQNCPPSTMRTAQS